MRRADGQRLPGFRVLSPGRNRYYYQFFAEADLVPPNFSDFRPQLPKAKWTAADKRLLLDGLVHAVNDPHYHRLVHNKVYYVQSYVMRNRFSMKEVKYALRMVAKKHPKWLPQT
jgi:hypothetical protein